MLIIYLILQVLFCLTFPRSSLLLQEDRPYTKCFSITAFILQWNCRGAYCNSWPTVQTFCFAARCLGRRFPSVPHYMLWLSIFIIVCSLYLALGVPIARDDWLNCFVKSRSPSSSLVTSTSVTLLDAVASPNAAMLLSITSEFSLFCLNS